MGVTQFELLLNTLQNRAFLVLYRLNTTMAFRMTTCVDFVMVLVTDIANEITQRITTATLVCSNIFWYEFH